MDWYWAQFYNNWMPFYNNGGIFVLRELFDIYVLSKLPEREYPEFIEVGKFSCGLDVILIKYVNLKKLAKTLHFKIAIQNMKGPLNCYYRLALLEPFEKSEDLLDSHMRYPGSVGSKHRR